MSLRAFGDRNKGRYRYSGRYDGGVAVYYYDDTPDGRVYSGQFWFKRRSYSIPHGKIVETVSGQYSGGLRKGRWTFTHKGGGMHSRLAVDYSEGRHEGKYKYFAVRRHSSTDFVDGISRISFSMSGDRPVGAVKGVFKGEILVGSYDSEGRPDGLWQVDSSKTDSCMIDYEVWEHGICREAYSVDVSTGTKRTDKAHITEFVASFVYRECLPLERLAGIGSGTWKGR